MHSRHNLIKSQIQPKRNIKLLNITNHHVIIYSLNFFFSLLIFVHECGLLHTGDDWDGDDSHFISGAVTAAFKSLFCAVFFTLSDGECTMQVSLSTVLTMATLLVL